MEILEAITAATLIKFLIGFTLTLASLITALVVIYNFYKKATLKILEKEFANMNTKIDDMQTDMTSKIDDMQTDMTKRLDDLYSMQEEAAIEACKNFLTHALVDIEQGADDEVLKKRIHSAHTWYNEHHQNSYIDTKFNKLVQEGKL